MSLVGIIDLIIDKLKEVKKKLKKCVSNDNGVS